MPKQEILYSEKYYDDQYEYRHIQVTPEMAKVVVPKNKLMTEAEWRSIGIQQSHGWIHYMIHEPEPHILLFRRPIPKGSAPSQEEQFRTEEEQFKTEEENC